MKLIAWLILAYLALGLQSGLSAFISVFGAPPNLILPVVIFIALYAPRDAALLGVYVLGLMQDVISQELLGVHALAYAAVALSVRFTQPAIHREHWLTHIVLALMGGLVHAGIVWLAGIRMGTRPPVQLLLIGVTYTMLLSVPILRLLCRFKTLFVAPVERKQMIRLR